MSRIPAALIYTFIAAIYVRRNVPRHPVACYVSRRMADLMAWLDRWELKQLGPLLAAQDIDLDALKYLIEDDFKELGLTIGLRRRLLRAIEEDLRRPAAELAPSAAGGGVPISNQRA